ncbi:alpha/beta fold hydrolase [Streptomyces sp. NPDC057137]|uniref:alpha/beta fold hydrolase n=1 Tax=Streptomyces sp. NPDC057137 TaxID=3346030 RepID=UPI003644E1B3
MTSAPPLHHVLSGPPQAPLLVLGPSLGTTLALWEPQLACLARDHQVLRFDLPGHGGSPTDRLRDPDSGSTTVDELAAGVLDLVDRLGRHRFHYAGISLGGAIGAQLAAQHPERIDSLALICSSAHFGPPEAWAQRAALVREKGIGPLLTTSPSRWFADPDTAATLLGGELLADLAATDPDGYAACCDALAAYDLRLCLSKITSPTLIIGGTHDVATPLAHAEELAGGIPRSVLEVIATGHLALEQPEAVRLSLLHHLDTWRQR